MTRISRWLRRIAASPNTYYCNYCSAEFSDWTSLGAHVDSAHFGG